MRQAIGPAHATLEATPVSQAMAAGTVGRRAYARTLVLLGLLHAEVEPALAADPELFAAFGRPQGRRAALERDLAVLGLPPAADGHPLANQLARTCTDRAGLLGAAFVVEGSRGGSRFLLPRLASALGVPPGPGVGLDLHLGASTAGSWPEILGRLDHLAWPAEDYARAGAAAAALMADLVPLFHAIDPREV